MLKVQLRHRLTADQVTAVRIGDRERITAFFVAAAKVAFEVHAPELIGLGDDSQGRGGRCYLSLALPGMDQPGAAQNRVDGAGGGPVGVTSRLLSARPQLARAPSRMLETELQDLLGDRLRRGMRTALWPVSQIFQSGGPGLLEAFDPLVAGFARDGVAQAEFSDAFLAFEHVGDKFHTFVHNATLFPRHGSDYFALPFW